MVCWTHGWAYQVQELLLLLHVPVFGVSHLSCACAALATLSACEAPLANESFE
jgi:hypothetical protein